MTPTPTITRRELLEIMPHRPPMLMIDEVVFYDDKSGVGLMTFPPDHCAVHEGSVLEHALVECLAQLAAAFDGIHHRNKGGESRGGMLVKVGNFRIIRKALAGETLRLESQIGYQMGSFHMATGSIYAGDELVAQGELHFIAGEPPSDDHPTFP